MPDQPSENAKNVAEDMLLAFLDQCPHHLSPREGEEGRWDDWINDWRDRIATALDAARRVPPNRVRIGTEDYDVCSDNLSVTSGYRTIVLEPAAEAAREGK